MSDLLFQQLSTVQSDKQIQPNTLASAAAIAPTTKFTRLTGTTPVTTITPPVSGYCELTFVWTTGTANGFTSSAAVNGIAVTYTTITDRPITLHFDPRTALWYPAAVI
jgi:Flp pilus assembly protein TadG